MTASHPMAETKRTISAIKKDKDPVQDLEIQVKDLRQQFADQLRCLETRTDVESSILLEIQDYFKRRADVELEYSRNLEKLAKQITARHKAEKQKRETWPLFSLYNWWQQLVEDTKTEARHRGVFADLCCHYMTSKLVSQSDQLQRISKRCREIGSDVHQEILRVLGELHTAMKTYQLCSAASSNAETKFHSVESQKQRFEESYPNKVGNRKHRFVEKEFEKKQAKFAELQLKSVKSRNEYLLCIDAANASLHKYFADDVSDLIDCMGVGAEQWMSAVLGSFVAARRYITDASIQQDNATKTRIDDFDARVDKRRFLEANHAVFTLPRKFEFRPVGSNESERRPAIVMSSFDSSVEDELRQRRMQLECRLNELKLENEEVWKTYATAERRLMEIQRLPELAVNDLFKQFPTPPTPPMQLQRSLSGSNVLSNPLAASSNAIGIFKADHQSTPRLTRNTCRESEAVLQKRKADTVEMEEYLLQKFHQYLVTANLIRRLESRYCQIQNAFGHSRLVHPTTSATSFSNGAHGSSDFQSIDAFLDSCHSLTSSYAAGENGGEVNAMRLASSSMGRLSSLQSKSKRKRIGRAMEFSVADGVGVNIPSRPRLFGGSIEEYVEATGEDIPLVIRSCVRMLSTFGLHHQGLFRVSGSQVEINSFKEAFEKGVDPLANVTDASDVNSVAGVLKLYFRELREPLFPMFMFDQFVDCTRSESKQEIVSKIKELLKTLPRPVYIAMRYLFGFLNHISEFSDENMMDPYNLAICFGPTLLPIPESRDQVFFHNHVNELMKNMIIYHEDVFPRNDPLASGGIVYEKCLALDGETNGIDDQNQYEEEPLADKETARYETMVVPIGADQLVGESNKKGRTKRVEHAYEELQPVLGAVSQANEVAALSPAHSTEPTSAAEDPQPRHMDDLNLSIHGSLATSPSSPNQQGPVQVGGTQFQQSDVWLLRQIGSSAAQGGNGQLSQRLETEKNSLGISGQAIAERLLDTRTSQLKREDDGIGFASNGSPCEPNPNETAPRGDVRRVAHPFGGTSSSSSTDSRTNIDYCQNRSHSGDGRKSEEAFGRNFSTSSEPSKQRSGRRELIGSLKRLSLGSYGVPTPASSTTAEHSGAPSSSNSLQLALPHDLEFIQQTDFTTAAAELSPTSLKEIQVELKAVLTSLESFTMQQQKSKGGDGRDLQLVDDATGDVERPDLVQNLPYPVTAASATPTTPDRSGYHSAIGEYAKLEPGDGGSGTLAVTADAGPAPRKSVHVSSSESPPCNRKCSSDSFEGYEDDAML